MKTLTIKDFASLFGCIEQDLPGTTISLIEAGNWNYRILDGEELNKLYENFFARINAKNFSLVKDHDASRWQKGWADNRDEFLESSDFSALVPKYIRPGLPIRLFSQYVHTEDVEFEYRWYQVLRDWFIRTKLKDFDVIYEFGCGSGHNIGEIAKIFPEKLIVGVDWVQPSIDILNHMRDKLGLNVEGQQFDFFNPDYSLELHENAAVITMGALEQTGTEHGNFFEYLLSKRPKACFHVEPIYEFYNPDSLPDYLAMRAHEEKNFWRGFPGYLTNLEKARRVIIKKSHKVEFGSLVTEGYSQIFWKLND